MKKLLGGINIIRLGGFSLGYGLTIALMSATLNRVMLADLSMSPFLVGFLFAIPMLVSPARMWFGYRSDGFRIFGLRREPYILGGAILTGISAFAIVLLVVNAQSNPAIIGVALLVLFALYGIGRNLGNNIFQALISDNFSNEGRRRAITLFEVVTLVGTVMGAGMIGKMLEEYDATRLVSVTLMVMVVMVVLAFIAILKQERPTEDAVLETAKAVPFRTIVNDVVLKDHRIRLFFLIIMFTIIGTQAQDAFLEPYGGLALGMTVGETTRLTQQWGIGVLIGMLASGLFLIKWLGYVRLLRIGLIASAFVFGGVIVAGIVDQFIPFTMLVFLMGLSTGLAAAGMLAGLITFTTPERAGLLLGVWGVANALGRAIGSFMGGGVVEVMLRLTGDNAFVAYAGVFVLEIVMLIGAFILTLRFQPIEAEAPLESDFDLGVALSGD